MGKWREKEINELIEKTETENPKNSPDSKFLYIDISSIDRELKKIVDPKFLKGSEAPSRARKPVLSGDILFATTRPSLQNIAIVKDNTAKLIASTGFCVLRSNRNLIENRFLFNFLLTNEVQELIAPLIRGAQYPAISDKDLKSIKIPLPPLPEQKRIVAKLDSLFVKIDKAISLLERNIGHTKALMSSVLDEEFGNSDKKSKSIKELVLKTQTLSPKAEFSNNQFTYIDISSVNNDIFQIENPKILLGVEAPSRARKIVKNEDVIFATTRPNLKNIAIVSEEYNNPIASTGFCVLRVKKEVLINEYLFYFLISERVQGFIQPLIRGAQYPAISDKDLLSVEIPFISIKEQEKTVGRIKSIFNISNRLIEIQMQKLTHLKDLKSSLLDQAFKGEL